MTNNMEKYQIKAPDVGVPKEKRTNDTKRLRIVCMSDSHLCHNNYISRIPKGDVLVHSGDFSQRMKPDDFENQMKDFNNFLGKLPHKHKIFVAGNHEIAFNNYKKEEIQKYLSNCVYLQDDSIKIGGIKFYGSPWNNSQNMGFSKTNEDLKTHWKTIDSDVNVLITHAAPLHILDLAWVKRETLEKCLKCNKVHNHYVHWGDNYLKSKIFETKSIQAHLFGHIHDDHGFLEMNGVLFVNSAMDISQKVYYFDYFY